MQETMKKALSLYSSITLQINQMGENAMRVVQSEDKDAEVIRHSEPLSGDRLNFFKENGYLVTALGWPKDLSLFTVHKPMCCGVEDALKQLVEEIEPSKG